MTNQEKIIMDILSEREYQNIKYGGINHDIKHSMSDWVSIITKHIWKAVSDDVGQFKLQMIKIAALAISALESYNSSNKIDKLKGTLYAKNNISNVDS